MHSTQVVRLTSLSDSDSPVLYGWLEDRDYRLYSGAFDFVSPEHHQEWFGRVRSARDGVALAVRAEGGSELLGLVQLLGIHPVHRHAELRIKLGPEHTDKGIGTQAVRLLCRHGFEDLNLERIYLHVASDNQRAVASYLKVGFQREGVLRRHAYVGGSYRDITVLGLLKEEM